MRPDRIRRPRALALLAAAATALAVAVPVAHAAAHPAADTTPPSAPGTPALVSDTATSVTVKWTASTDNVGVTAYDVYHDGQLCDSVDGTTLTGTCSSLSPKTAYGFYVNARDAAGNVSQPSATLSVTTPGSTDTTPPTTPTGVHTTSVTNTSVGVAWTASTDNVGVAGYRVYNVVGGVRTQLGGADASTTSAQLDGLTPSTAYHLQVTAYDANNNESTGSTPILDVTTKAGGGCSASQAICSVTQVGTDDDVVWGLVTLPDGTLLFNERDAHDIVHLNPKTGAKTTIGTVPNVQSTDGEGGLTGLEINPVSFSTDHWLYLMHTSPTDNRIVRIKYDPAADKLLTSTEQILLTGIARNKYHNGGRLRFSPDGRYLYAGTGDAQDGSNAQNVKSLNGKVLRIEPDGTIPPDNPFHNAVWSYGHRNVQGLAFDSQGRLWEQEFGNSIMDETNLIVKGGNYGWPSCEGTSGTCGTKGFIAPKHTYPVAEGSCSGITIVNDVLYVACERGQRLYREVISGSGLTNVQQFFVDTYGRLRTVEPAPDGGLWLATTNGGDKDSTPHNSDNKIFHLTLATTRSAAITPNLANGLALTPPMGFNDWNAVGCGTSESFIEQTADFIHAHTLPSGKTLQQSGYTYVNIDDCWALPNRDSSGNLVPDPSKFPDGISGTAAYVHKLGLKLGLYNDSGLKTCSSSHGFPGSYQHEAQDALQFAKWGVDYLKDDNCNQASGQDTRAATIARYTAMSNGLAAARTATGQAIVFSICQKGDNGINTEDWSPSVGNLWRTTSDVHATWSRLDSIIDKNIPLAPYAHPGAWNDPDMLEVGNSGLTATEQQTQFSMWAEMAAPLLIGTKLASASSATLTILGNGDVIAVDQDALGDQGKQVSDKSGLRVLAKPLSGGDVAVAFFNETGSTASISTTASAVGLGSAADYQVRDLWTHTTSTTSSGSWTESVPSHGTVLLRIHSVTSNGVR